MSWVSHLGRFLISTFVLTLLGWVVPGFKIAGFGNAFLFSIVIALIAWGMEKMWGTKITPFGRGLIGFTISAIVIWISQYLVQGVSVTWFGAFIAAFIIGIADLFIPIGRILKHKSSRGK